MNVEDEKKLREIAEGLACYTDPDALREAYALGRRAGMTEAAAIADQWATPEQRKLANGGPKAAIEKARDAK